MNFSAFHFFLFKHHPPMADNIITITILFYYRISAIYLQFSHINQKRKDTNESFILFWRDEEPLCWVSTVTMMKRKWKALPATTTTTTTICETILLHCRCLKKVHRGGRSNSSANYKSTSVIQDIHAIHITKPLLFFISSLLPPPLNWISIHGVVLLRQIISQHETALTSSEFGGEDSRGIPSAF